MKKLLYIGNNVSKHGFNKTTIETLGKSFEAEGYDVYYTSNKKNQLLRLLDMILSTIRYSKMVDYIIIDTYSTSSFWYAFFCSQIARASKTKYIPILHGGNLPNRLKKNPLLSKIIFQNAYKNIAPSNYLKSEFEKVGFQNVMYISNSIELDKYVFKNRQVFEPKLLWVRAFATIYNPNMAVYVLKELQNNFPNASLTMVGPDKDGSLLKTKELAKELGLAINFTGQLPKEEWWGLAKEHDFFINTTHFDNTPVSVIEAMALGLPVISTNVGGIPFLLKDNKNAILVNDKDSLGMANAIISLIEDNEKAASFSRNGRFFAEQLDWRVIKYQWKKLFR